MARLDLVTCFGRAALGVLLNCATEAGGEHIE